AGMGRLGWGERPSAIHDLQAAAAVGQSGLVEAYEERFTAHGLLSAQVLLTHDDLSDRRRYLNARNTLRALIGLDVIPVVNENDTVVTEEIRFGDNDTLAALVANLTEADMLVILTDSRGLFEADPRLDPHAGLVSEGEAGDPALLAAAGGAGSKVGTGGMRTKVLAAQRAARSGTATVIASGQEADVLLRLARGEAVGTFLHPGRDALVARKQWLANQLQVKGRIHVDAGAARVIREQGRSLLPVGVVSVEGGFQRGEVVACIDPDGREVCRGLVSYAAAEIRRIAGEPSSRIAEILGYLDTEELIHRDDLAVV
ncbi:MAG TPA: glutamate 5-kinase, partial [Gammaproteobacteria bacterium]|nr:glutamate 5-kinase [Gammaproteobacteria bacterium]